MTLNGNARPRRVGDLWGVVRDLRRDVDFLRSARAVTDRSPLAALVEGADSVAGAALVAAVAAQGTADAASTAAAGKARIRSGTASGTSSSTGEFTITHALGAVPGLATAQVPGSPDLYAVVVSSTSTEATFLLVDRNTGAAASTAYTCTWAVIA